MINFNIGSIVLYREFFNLVGMKPKIGIVTRVWELIQRDGNDKEIKRFRYAIIVKDAVYVEKVICE